MPGPYYEEFGFYGSEKRAETKEYHNQKTSNHNDHHSNNNNTNGTRGRRGRSMRNQSSMIRVSQGS